MNYENSILWSPQFTPWNFKDWFALPGIFFFILSLFRILLLCTFIRFPKPEKCSTINASTASSSLSSSPKAGSSGGWMSTESPTLFLSFRPKPFSTWINFIRKACLWVEVGKSTKNNKLKPKRGNQNLSEEIRDLFFEYFKTTYKYITHSFVTLLTLICQIN